MKSSLTLTSSYNEILPECTSLKDRQWLLMNTSDLEEYPKKDDTKNHQLQKTLLTIRINLTEDFDQTHNNFQNKTLAHIKPYLDKFHQSDHGFLMNIILNQDDVVLWTDYDVDGQTSAATLYHYLTFMGHPREKIHTYIPHRTHEGYGPNIQGFQSFKDKGITKIIVTDSGTTAQEPLNWAFENKLEVLVIDHHKPSENSKNIKCLAMINPQLDKNYDKNLASLCGVGLVFMVILKTHRNICEQYKNNKLSPTQRDRIGLVMDKNFLNELLPLVALGTVCDMMVLGPLNRILITEGIQRWHLMTQAYGLQKFWTLLKKNQPIDETSFGFVLGPHMNASGRIHHAKLGLDLLIENNDQRIDEIMCQLQILNKERRETQQTIFLQATEAATKQHHKNALILWDENWALGVVGLVAGKLKDKYGKPCFIAGSARNMGDTAGSARNMGDTAGSARNMGDTAGSARNMHTIETYMQHTQDINTTEENQTLISGSIRSCDDYDIFHNIIQPALEAKILIGGGGHAMAGGFRLYKHRWQDFQNFIWETVPASVLLGAKKLKIDSFVNFYTLNRHDFLLEILSSLRPFGMRNPHPVVACCFVSVKSIFVFNENYWSCTFVDLSGERISCFCSDAIGDVLYTFLQNILETASKCHITLEINAYYKGDKQNISLSLRDVKAIV